MGGVEAARSIKRGKPSICRCKRLHSCCCCTLRATHHSADAPYNRPNTNNTLVFYNIINITLFSNKLRTAILLHNNKRELKYFHHGRVFIEIWVPTEMVSKLLLNCFVLLCLFHSRKIWRINDTTIIRPDCTYNQTRQASNSNFLTNFLLI